MRISFVLPPVNLSGGIRVVATYAERLRALGHEVFTVSPPHQQPSVREQLRSVRRGHGLINRRHVPSHFDYAPFPHHIIDSYRPITDADLPPADAVIATWWETADWVAALSAEKGTKFYFIQHHETHDYFPKERVRATYHLPLHKIVVSDWLVEVMRSVYGHSDVSLVPNAVDGRLFNAPPRRKQPAPTFGLMYSTTRWKGSDIALDAFAQVQAQSPTSQLVAFGMVKPSRDLPLPPNVRFHFQPPQAQLRSLYAQCDAWLFTSRVEGFGLTILEAMACRTPVIATPAGAAPQLINDTNGFLAPPESSPSIAAAMQQVIGMSNGAWKQLSAAAHRTASTYTWDDATSLFEQSLREGVARQVKRRAITGD